MKTEEKAKAYDEALERAKRLYNGTLTNGLNSVDLEDIFPELRESEDERIRKELVDFLQSPFIKENLIDKYVAPWLVYLEKQKENPKSTDSIPSDCTLDAKCEDRWHKVEDSLPDDGREVICKDAIGNYFIGRYYECSDSWEVMMYDDCDKSNEDNPPVVMWVDIPSEKQKEQKPAPISCGHENGFVSKPSECSEEDDWKVSALLDMLATMRQLNSSGSLVGIYSKMDREKKFDEIENWLKSLPERLNLQPKQEWNEEDSKRYISIGTTLDTSAVLSKEDYDANMVWLRDLVNSKKYSSPRPHWKPSKEQMEALESAVKLYKDLYKHTHDEIYYERIAQVLEQLEKLM